MPRLTLVDYPSFQDITRREALRQNQILIHKAAGNAGGEFYVSDVVLMYQLYIDI